ncbi:receptor-like protein 12 [Chenopodium quinoa]|uniref:Leucine-rich repeat-containing N-terminal plant-type domain-containing protein n=1 Tax=Chenopodium quinoa TaxID=63459 RepID=A0A803LMH4_CHEQI|nr:receptor-like protein 12 [Chenopodium quinoa]
MKNLESISLNGNNFKGSINGTEWEELLSLKDLDLSDNSLDGSISMSLFSLPSLQSIDLSGNKFSGQLNEFSGIASSHIVFLDLRNNSLEGIIPKSFFQLRELGHLDLSFNRLNGTLDLANILQSFKNLIFLDLSFNHLSIGTNDYGENSPFPQLSILYLASCNLRTIPKFLQNQTSLDNLDLSMNQITGTIPGWLWQISSFNLSFNHLVELEPPFPFSNDLLPRSIDLSSNNLHGQFPVVKSGYAYLDCSNNNFTSIDPANGNYLSYASYMSFSRNNLQGVIPASLCNGTNLELLNLEHNHLVGTIPDCFTTMTQLIVLNLRGNQLHSEIPDRFTKGCSLQTLDLNGNFLQRRIPRSLVHCKDMKIPTGAQLQTFDASSYTGNQGLFGSPLTTHDPITVTPPTSSEGSNWSSKSEREWMLRGAEVGFPVGITIFIGPILYIKSCIPFVSSQCLRDQKSLLLELKNNLAFAPNAYDKLKGWNQSTDCCHWSGVTCNNSNGRVIGLDLSSKDIIGGIDDSSSLYHLQFLQTLNLASNNDLQGEIPSRIGTLSSLTYLNLSWVGFSGQVPIEISNLVKLAVLDISNSGVENSPLYMHKPNLATIIRNLTNIKELYLDYVINSAIGDKWCKTLSSSLPRLQVMSMSNCDLRGEIHKSLSNLRHLSVIMLDDNGNMGGRVPGFMARFTNLTKLSLSVCGLYGIVPSKNFQVPTLRALDLSGNEKLQGNLPVFYKNGSLEELCLSSTNFSGTLPRSISNLKRLRAIDLSRNQFFGILPSSLSNLKRLLRIDLSYNQFSGPIPSFSSLKYLKSINLGFNNLNGSINATDWDRLLSLEELNLSYNSLDGKISTSLFSLPSLQFIDLYKNKFSGQLNEFASIASSQISYLDLRYNSLEGPIPKSFFQLRELQFLYMSFNRLNGTLDLADFLQRFKSLKELDLSFNRLSVGTNDSGENSTFPQLQILFLASCNLRTIPKFLNNQTSLQNLDLSMNQITGTIPEWMWKITRFNLSFNHLVELEPPLSFSNNLGFIEDLSSNNLQGKFPVVKSNYYYLDCSNNNFSSINPDIGNYLSYASYMSFSNLGSSPRHYAVPKI